jgi:hypothetical protein
MPLHSGFGARDVEGAKARASRRVKGGGVVPLFPQASAPNQGLQATANSLALGHFLENTQCQMDKGGS